MPVQRTRNNTRGVRVVHRSKQTRDPRSECPGYPPVACWQMHRQAFCTFPILLVHQLSTGIIVEPGNDLEVVADWKIQSAHILNQHHQWLAKG